MRRILIILVTVVLVLLVGLGGQALLDYRHRALTGPIAGHDSSAAAAPHGSWTATTQPETARQIPPGALPPRLVDVTAKSGIDFRFFRGETPDRWVPEVTGGGAAWFDYDGDGWLDLYLVNGCQLPADPGDSHHRSRLYRNRDNGTFCEVTDQAGVGHNGAGQGCDAADYDNDGFDDLYVTCYGSNVLYHNNGDGTFSDRSVQAAPDSSLWSCSGAFADLDLDGNLDLYVCNYLDFNPLNAPTCTHPNTGERMHCGPRFFRGLPHMLLRNRGDGAFADISSAPGISLPAGKGLGVLVADLNNDGRPDLYVANDGEPNFLFLNHAPDYYPRTEPVHSVEPGFTLTNAALELGAGVNAEGVSQGSMGLACGDYDRDGDLDLAVTNFYLEYLTMYRNLGPTGFVDVSKSCGLVTGTRPQTGWGTGFLDYDNDGWLDLFASNGHTSLDETGAAQAMPAQLFRNARDGRFLEVSEFAGPYFAERWVGRGCAFGDFDNDGRTDIVVVHHYRPTALLRNETEFSNHCLQIELVGRTCNRSAVNARVWAFVSAPGTAGAPNTLLHEIVGGGSYQSANDRRIRLGLGAHAAVDALEVRWPSGLVQRWVNVRADQVLRIIEGRDPQVVRNLRIAAVGSVGSNER